VSTVAINGTVAVPGTAGMSVVAGATMDVTLARQFSADLPVVSVERVSPALVVVTSAVAVVGASPPQFEDFRGQKRGIRATERKYPAGRIVLKVTQEGCTAAVNFGDGTDPVEYAGLWRGTPTIKVDGVALPVKE